MKKFWEKPARQVAEELLDRGCVWNTFVMVGHAGAFLNLIRSAAPAICQNVHVSAQRREGQILFAVSDNGVGIDPKCHQRIFQPCRRLQGPSIPGIGLGLAICKRVIERYEGQIWVESLPGRGATFMFTLPTHAIEPR